MDAEDPLQSLHASERAFRLLAESSPAMITRSGIDGAMLYVSPAIRDVLGVAPEEYRGARTWEHVHADDLARVAEARRRVIADGRPRTVEFRARHADGRELWLESSMLAIRDERTGELAEIHGATRDITERRAHDELRRLWKLSFEGTTRGIAIYDPAKDAIESVNGAYARMHGGVPADFEGRPLASMFTAAEAARIDARATVIDDDGYVLYTSDHVRLDGSVFPVESEVVAARDGDGRVLYRIGYHVDLTEQRAREESERRAVERFERSFSEAPVGMLLLRGRRIERANRALAEQVGVDAEELVGRDPLDFVHPDDVERSERSLVQLDDGRDPAVQDRRIVGAHGAVLHMRLRYSILHDAVAGEAPLVLIHFVDRTAEVAANAATQAARELFETAFATAPVGMVISRAGADGTTAVLQCNAAFATMIGRTPAELVGRSGELVVHPDDLPLRRRLIDDMLEGRAASAELRLKHRDGHDVWAQVAPATTIGPDDERLYVLQAVDISERKRFEERLRHLADHDPLTGLFSRRRFEEELDREVGRTRRSGAPAALLLLDLDAFKRVNDSLGHGAGDALLARVAGGLKGALRSTDVVARLGGDEFAAILADTDGDGARAVAAKLVDVVREHGGEGSGVTASIGVTTWDGADRATAEELLVQADVAMYEAKGAGKDRVAVHARAARAIA